MVINGFTGARSARKVSVQLCGHIRAAHADTAAFGSAVSATPTGPVGRAIKCTDAGLIGVAAGGAGIAGTPPAGVEDHP